MPIRYCFQKPLKEITIIVYKLTSLNCGFLVGVVGDVDGEAHFQEIPILDIVYEEIRSGL